MSDRGDAGWTVVLLRKGGLRSWSWRLRSAPVAAAVAGALLLLLALGAGLALAVSASLGSAREARLQARIDTLTRERTKVLALAARLDSVDAAYRKLRRVMDGAIAPSDKDLELPPAEPADQSPPVSVSTRTSGPDSFDWPLAQKGFITRSFQQGAEGASEGHRGIDIAVPSGSYVRAVAPGVVAAAGQDSIYGRYVRIDHGGGVETLYGHNLWLFVQRGDSVARDQVIALSGSSGRSTAPHLHFEVTRRGRSVDPARYLRARGG